MYKIGMLGSIYFVGWCVGLPIFISLSDIIGRKKIVVFGLGFQTVIHVAMLMSTNYTIAVTLMFFYGLICPAGYIIIYTYTMEFIPNDRQTFVGTMFNIVDGLTYLIQTLYF